MVRIFRIFHKAMFADKVIVFLLIFFHCFLFSSCNNDFLGLFISSELSERLMSADDFVLLSNADLNADWGSEFSFLVITDLHIENENVYGLEKITDIVNDPANDIKFIVAVGDITQGGHRRDLQKFIDVLSGIGLPFYPVIGNHEVYFGNWHNWRDMIGSSRYRVNGGETTLFILDTANAFLGRSQLSWLENELKTAAKNVFVFSHVNVFAEGPVDFKMLSDHRERAMLVSILAGKANLMISGHTHRHIARDAGGVRYLSVDDFKVRSAYCIVNVSPQGVNYTMGRIND